MIAGLTQCIPEKGHRPQAWVTEEGTAGATCDGSRKEGASVTAALADLEKPGPPHAPHTHLQSSASPSGAGLRGMLRQMWETPGGPPCGAQGVASWRFFPLEKALVWGHE